MQEPLYNFFSQIKIRLTGSMNPYPSSAWLKLSIDTGFDSDILNFRGCFWTCLMFGFVCCFLFNEFYNFVKLMKGLLLNIWRHRFLEFYILMKGLLLNIKSIGGYLDTTYLSLDCNECIQITMTCCQFFTKKTIEEFLKHEEEANFNSNTYIKNPTRSRKLPQFLSYRKMRTLRGERIIQVDPNYILIQL